MKRKQKGMTLIGFIISMSVAGVFVYVGMQLFPMYNEFFSVKSAMASLANEPGIAQESKSSIEAKFFKRLYISYSDNVKPQNLKLVPKEAGWVMTVDYEVRRPVIANLDVVGKFHAEKELARKAQTVD
jgi:Tfp pilus assembly protein PilE